MYLKCKCLLIHLEGLFELIKINQTAQRFLPRAAADSPAGQKLLLTVKHHLTFGRTSLNHQEGQNQKGGVSRECLDTKRLTGFLPRDRDRNKEGALAQPSREERSGRAAAAASGWNKGLRPSHHQELSCKLRAVVALTRRQERGASTSVPQGTHPSCRGSRGF